MGSMEFTFGTFEIRKGRMISPFKMCVQKLCIGVLEGRDE